MLNSTPRKVDIFCRVIDNYGDIGVCWRLAKDLSFYSEVRLWVDDLNVFSAIDPLINPKATQQIISPKLPLLKNNHLVSRFSKSQITINRWPLEWSDTIIPADFVIETFGVELPLAYRSKIPQYSQCWINLEYLSAEQWVTSFHAQPSLQNNGFQKFFFFPGFGTQTGGLLREKNLLSLIDHFKKNDDAKQQFLNEYVSQKNNQLLKKDQALVFIFCYPDAPYLKLLSALAKSTALQILVPEGVLVKLENELQDLNNISIIRIPFLSQEMFDFLLALSDLNIVRGEDSFIRAHWVNQAFLWHIYPQQEDTHLIKLNAWLDIFDAPDEIKAWHLYWNAPNQFTCPKHFDWLLWKDFAQNIRNKLQTHPSLSKNLLSFYQSHTVNALK